MIHTAEENGYEMRILKAVEEVNEKQKGILFDKFNKYFKGDIRGKTVALWGLSFKPETDDMREAPSLTLMDLLLTMDCKLRVFDPASLSEAKKRLGDKVYYAENPYDAALGADALFLLTEWKEFRLPSWETLKKTMNHPVVFDGRNIYDKKELTDLGFDYFCIGR